MQQHEQPLAPAVESYDTNQQGPLSAGSEGASYASPVAAPANEPIPQTMGAKEAKSLHKTLDKEAKAEDSNIKHQIKDIGKAEKAERKAEKADSKALKKETKAVESLHSTNKELERAQAKHDQAIREAEKAKKEVDIKKDHHVQITQALQNKKAELENLSKTRETHHHQREGQISQLDKIINSSKS